MPEDWNPERYSSLQQFYWCITESYFEHHMQSNTIFEKVEL